MVPALIMILIVTFSLIHLAPGDPAGAFAGEDATQATIDDINRQYGLDQPILSQFWTYAMKIAHGDLGQSFAYGRPVTAVIAERLPATLLLTGAALVLSVLGGILVGTLAARRPGPVDAGITGAALFGYAVPSFWLGQVAILVIALEWKLLPALGMTDTRVTYTGLDQVLDVGQHLILPALVLAASEIALVIRLTRTGLRQQLAEAYVRTASAKGLSGKEVLDRHAFPVAALPLITVIGTRIGFLFSGAVVVETVFSWPGIGLLLTSAVTSGDRPMVLALVLIVAVSVLLANLVTDLVYARTDPRIRYD